MKNRDNRPENAAPSASSRQDLRRRAEEIARGKKAPSQEDLDAHSHKETRQMLHELLVHQIELEMQNEELRRTQAELDAARARYFDLYDLAPVGYCTVSEKGMILEANLTAATLLGVAKGTLVKQPLTRFILPCDQDIYYRHRKLLFETCAPQVCELRLVKQDGSQLWAQFEATVAQDGENGNTLCRAVMSDITKRKRAEELLIQNKRFSQLLNDLDALVYVVDMKTYDVIFINAYGKNIWGDIEGKICWQTIQVGQAGPCEFCTNSKLIGPDGNPTEGVVWEFQNTVNKRWYDCRDRAIYWPDGRVVRMEIATDITKRKQAEEALRRVEENFRSSLDESALGVRIVTAEGETIYANRAILDIYGYDSVEEMRTTPVKKRYTPESYAEFRIRRKKRRQGDDDPSEYEISIVKKSGEIRRLQVLRKTILWDGERRFQVIYNDITERMQAEKALRESEERFRKLADSTWEGIIIHKEGIIIDVNESLLKMIGFHVEEVIGKRFIDFLAPESIESASQKLREGTTHDQLYLEVKGLRKDNTVFSAEALGRPIRYKNLDARVIAVRDITLRKRAEEDLLESEERYRSLFKNNHAVMLLIDPDSAAIIDANPAACTYYGWSREELMKRRIDEINTLRRKEVAAEMQLARAEKRNHFFFKHRRADGTIRDVEVYSGPIILKGKALLYSIVHDITDRKQAEEKLAVESHHLAETNTALRVLLQRREEDQKEMERKILANIKKLVLPNLEKLRSLKLNDIQATCLDVVAANLQQVISPFLQNLTARFADFTPREIEVANMIREGKTSKEIANIFNTSIGNVDFHRDNIRKKLGLSHKKSNLRTFLMKLSEK
jgi:PAS domain S-box-containing protein